MSEEEEGDLVVNTENSDEVVFVEKIYGNNRIYTNTMGLAEFVQVIYTRADQISNGAEIFIQNQSGHACDLAIKEVIAGVCPLSIIRKRGKIGNKEYVEVWDVNELDVLQKCISSSESIFDKGGKIDIVSRLKDLFNEK